MMCEKRARDNKHVYSKGHELDTRKVLAYKSASQKEGH